jgi:hypothetical protein
MIGWDCSTVSVAYFSPFFSITSGTDTRRSLLSNVIHNQGQGMEPDEVPMQDSSMDVTSQLRARRTSGLLEPPSSRRKRKSMETEGFQEQSSPSLRRSKRIKISVPLKDVDLEW